MSSIHYSSTNSNLSITNSVPTTVAKLRRLKTQERLLLNNINMILEVNNIDVQQMTLGNNRLIIILL